jgi:Membrane proteins related to metalloendopeptidases
LYQSQRAMSKTIYPIMGLGYKAGDFAKVNLDKITLASLGISTPAQVEAYMDEVRALQSARWLYGGYLEHRALYQSSLFIGGHKKRDHHLAIDIWGPVGSKVYAPIEGQIHSFAYNDKLLDYGYTLLICHIDQDQPFYTLYGHLSSAFYDEWRVGKIVTAGEVIGEIGDKEENGGWLPHLHFQIIKDLETYVGDYPGVCSIDDIPLYRENCPDPMRYIRFE